MDWKRELGGIIPRSVWEEGISTTASFLISAASPLLLVLRQSVQDAASRPLYQHFRLLASVACITHSSCLLVSWQWLMTEAGFGFFFSSIRGLEGSRVHMHQNLSQMAGKKNIDWSG